MPHGGGEVFFRRLRRANAAEIAGNIGIEVQRDEIRQMILPESFGDQAFGGEAFHEFVIPGRAKREPGIHSHSSASFQRKSSTNLRRMSSTGYGIPGSRQEARPGMTGYTFPDPQIPFSARHSASVSNGAPLGV